MTSPMLVTTSLDSLRTILTDTFEGHALTCVELDGRPAYIAREIGEALGYAQRGRRFADRVTSSWSKEMEEGRDYTVLEGDALALFKKLSTGSVDSFTPSMLILFERGLHLALLKTTMPAGVRLRAWLAERVMPGLARGEAPEVEDISAAQRVCDRQAALAQEAVRIALEEGAIGSRGAFAMRLRLASLSPDDPERNARMLDELAADLEHRDELRPKPPALVAELVPGVDAGTLPDNLPPGKPISLRRIAQVRQIRALLDRGWRNNRIAKAVGVPSSFVSQVKNRVRFAWLDA